MSEEEREFLLRSIADLDAEHEAGDIADDDYRRLRDDYVARAAAALRGETGTAAATAPRARPGRARAAVVGAAVVAAALGAGWLVASSAGERVGDAPASGAIEEASTDRIARAQLLVREGKVLDAIKVYDELLADDPENPVALAERGWLISRVDESLVDRGLASIDRALAVDPGYAEAHFYRGMILFQAKNDPAGAATAFEQALANDPPPDLRTFLEDARNRARAASAP